MTFADAALTVVVAGITAWVVPWPKWQVEKLRLRNERRRKLIDDMRRDLLPAASRGEDVVQAHPLFAVLTTYSRPKFIEHFSRGRTVVLHGSDAWLLPTLAQEIGWLESQWKLI